VFWYVVGVFKIFKVMEYLVIDILAVIVPFIFTFHKKLRFYKEWASFALGVVLVAVPFVVWDVIFTSKGVWGFDSDYLIGFNFFLLPLEELLFFVCIPYASLFTYHCFSILWKEKSFKKLNIYGSYFLMALSFCFAILNYDKLYTFYTAIFLFTTLLVLKVVLDKKWIGKFIAVYGVLLIPFTIVNGILTGSLLPSPIVWYNDDHNLGVRVGTIPIEDIFYGFLLILLFVFIYEKNSRGTKIS